MSRDKILYDFFGYFVRPIQGFLHATRHFEENREGRRPWVRKKTRPVRKQYKIQGIIVKKYRQHEKKYIKDNDDARKYTELDT